VLAVSDKLKILQPTLEKSLLAAFLLAPLLLLALISREKYLGIAALSVVALLIVIIQNYRYGLYFLIIGLPIFQSVAARSDAATSTGINLQYILIPAVFVAWLSEKMTKKELAGLKFPHFSILLVFVIALLLSIINQMDVVTIGHIRHGIIQLYALLNYLILFYIIVNEDLNEKRLNKIFWGFLIVALLTAVVGIYQYFTIKPDQKNIVRVTSLFGSILRSDTKNNPNDFGTYLGFMIMVGLMMWRLAEKKKRLMLAVIISLTFVTLIFTFSRSSLLATVFAVLFFTYHRSKKAFVITIVAVIFGMMLLYFDPRFQSRLHSIYAIITNKRIINIFLHINPQNLDWEYIEYYGIQGYGSDIISGAFRIWAWFQGMHLFLTHPFFGIGYHLTLAFSPWPTAENLYLDFASMTGLFGFSIFLALQIIFLKDGFKMLRSEKYNHIGMFWLSILAVSFVASLTGSVLFSGKLLGIFWILGGLFYNVKQRQENHNLHQQ